MSIVIPVHHQALAERRLKDKEFIELAEALDAGSTDECVDCGMELGGLLGMFQWGIVHGHGECSRCGFPYVYYHYHEGLPAIPVPMLYPRPAEEILIMAWVPNAEIPLAEELQKARP